MTAATVTPYRSSIPDGPDRFRFLLRAEWTKFRTVRGWVLGLIAAALVTVGFGVLTAAGSQISCDGPGGPGTGAECRHTLPLGPGGEAVVDRFYLVHQPLAGDGSITARVTSLTGRIINGPQAATPGVQPWSKAGLMVKESTAPGSAYAAIMVTGGHGVRMQHNFTGDTAGGPAKVTTGTPQYLRLTRSGDTVTGYESADGTTWNTVGTARLAGLPSTATVGMFVTSPQFEETTQNLGGMSSTGGPTEATATFDRVGLEGAWSGGAWRAGPVGGVGDPSPIEGSRETGGTFEVTGSGDIAPAVSGPGGETMEQSLVGAFAGLIGVVVVGALFVTAEYRRGLIRETLLASPRRGRVLAAKALVLGGVTFVAMLVAAGFSAWYIADLRYDRGVFILPAPTLTEMRVVAGTAALLAVAAVFALGVGAVLRRSASAVAAVIVLIVLPYLLAVASVVPVGAGEWLLRVTPAAAFAIQQSLPEYAQVDGDYIPQTGYFPLAPWAGFAVLVAWTALALALAAARLHRRDA